MITGSEDGEIVMYDLVTVGMNEWVLNCRLNGKPC